MSLFKQISKRRQGQSRRIKKASHVNEGSKKKLHESQEHVAANDSKTVLRTSSEEEEEEAFRNTSSSMDVSMLESASESEVIPKESTDPDHYSIERKTATANENIGDDRQKLSSKSEKKNQRQRLNDEEALNRQELRLGGFEPYVFVSVLSAQASYGELGLVEVNWDKIVAISSYSELLEDDWFKLGVLIAAAGSTVAGLYSSVVFSLTILYGKTALGMDRDEEYFGFMERTSMQRYRAFKAFTWSLFLFLLSVVFEVSMKVGRTAKLPCLLLSIAMLFYLKKEYECIMAAAAPMFAPRKNLNTDNDSDQ